MHAPRPCRLVALLLLFPLPGPAGARPLPGQPPRPAWETDAERARQAHPPKNATFRAAHPELYGRTDAPTAPVTFYAEYAAVSHITFTWWPGLHDDFFAGITAAVAQYGNATVSLVVEDAAQQADLAAALASRSIDTAHVEYLDISGYPYYVSPYNPGPLDSYWFVDYGPFWVQDGSGTLAIVDPRYYPDRTNDDGLPAKLADLLGLSTFRPDLNLEGGNLMADGAGTCILTSKHLLRNADLWPYQVDEILEAYFGCEQVIWLEPLANERTGHVDMFAKWLTPTTLIVGEYTAQQDADNADILDENALRLANASNLQNQPLQVVRIPMPDKGQSTYGTVWRTYTNSILVNDLVVVPTYADETSHEAAALAVYQSVLPAATILGLDSDDIIPEGGAIHCVTRTRPTGTATPLQAAPADACGGAWDCPPTGCADLDEAGLCLVGIAAWCDAGEIVSEHCLGDEVCGWSAPDNGIRCVAAGCDGLTAAGECRVVDGADFALWCDADGLPRAERCMAFETCDASPTLGRVTCLDTPPDCTHECSTDETGCATDNARSWICGEAGDGDDCLERIFTPCDAGETCVDGACTCQDECAAGETGCADAATVWTCGEAGDGDDCLERRAEPCPAGNTCAAGACVCQDECAAGETGCASDLLGEWTCGEAGDGDDCLERVRSDCATGEVCRENGCEPEQRPLEPGGCACSSGGPSGDSSPLLLLILGFALVLRRRRE